MADVMDKREKMMARQEYMQEVEKVNWNNIEQNLKANYDKLNWDVIKQNVNVAMNQVRLDSVHKVYTVALAQLEKLEKDMKTNAKVKCSPIPDCSVKEITLAKETLRRNIDSVKGVRTKKVVEL